VVECGGLENRCASLRRTEGSNPSPSAPEAAIPDRSSSLNHQPAWADETSMGRLVFYPVAIGLFVLLDMALRAHGH
jgi:hypothetical protein